MRTKKVLEQTLLAACALLSLGFARAADNIGTGGTITFTDATGLHPRSSPAYPGGYVVHSFTASGTLTLPTAVTADVLVVAGGGGGGYFAGGGGGGGLIYSAGVAVGAGTTVTVGAGGAGAATDGVQGTNGQNSVFPGSSSTFTATGGGGGGSRGSAAGAWRNGAVGGSGGGGSGVDSGSSGTGGAASPAGQGNAGGTGAHWGAGGGGGAGAAGASAVGEVAGKGGNGLAYAIAGASTYYAGGGGGGTWTGNAVGAGGLGGGAPGANGNQAGASGAANTGGGGGGGSLARGGAGGSGVVIVRYPFVSTDPVIALGSPANNQPFWPGTPIPVTALAGGGTPNYTVTYHYKLATDASFTVIGPVGPFDGSNTFAQTLGILPTGTYQIYATVTDSASPAVGTATSETNTFVVSLPQGNSGSGGTLTYTDSTGSNPRSAQPYADGYVVQSFTTSGTLSLPASITAEVLVVGGGGGRFGGGGGAGGFLTGTTSIPGGVAHTVTVGAGGTGVSATGSVGGSGGDSVFQSFTALGGGGGGSRTGNTPATGVNGAAGASGGGGSASDSGPTSGGAGTAAQGNAGGAVPWTTGSYWGSAGGGGAGAAGGNASGTGTGSTSTGGNGGAGLSSGITGTPVFYAGGGGGGSYSGGSTAGSGGNGGGGNGTKVDSSNGGAGTANTGGGGGGGGYVASGGNGGSGIVIVKYPYAASAPLVLAVTRPADNQLLLHTGSAVSATAGVAGGRSPYTVTYHYKPTDAPGFTATAAVGPFDGSNPFAQTLDVLPVGSYQIYATVTDSDSATATSATIAFSVVGPPVWTNAAGGSWPEAGNWQSGVIGQGSGWPADFSTLTLAADAIVTLDGSRTIGSLVFGDGGNQYGWIIDPGSPAGTLTLDDTSTPVIAVNNRTTTLNAGVAGSVGLTKAGNGTLVLTNTNPYSGGTTINGGTLQLGDGGITGSLGSGDLVNNANLALYYNSNTTYDLNNLVSGTGTVHVIGGNLRLNAQGSTGLITVDSGGDVMIWAPGPVTLSNDFVLDSMGYSQNRGGINQDGGAGLVTLNGQLTLNGDSRLGCGGLSYNHLLVNGKVTGIGKLYAYERNTANPATELRLTNAANDYSGGTEIEQGRVSITQAGAIGSGPVTITGANSQLLVDEITATIPNNLTLGGGGNPVSTNYAYGNATLVFHNDAQTATLAGTVTLAGDAKVRHYSAGGTTIFNNPIDGSGNLTFEAGGAAATHNQTWLFGGSGASTYGSTTIRSDGSANPIVRINGGTLPATGTLTLSDAGGRDAVFDLNGQSQTVAGLIGTVSGLGEFVMNSGATPSTLTVSNAADNAFGGVIGVNTTTATTGQAAGGTDIAMIKSGVGTLTLTGANTYTGTTAVNEGTLLVGGFGVIGSVTIPNAGFETPAVTGYLYTPAGASWTFNFRSGICSNTFNPTAAPEGARCAFIQDTGTGPGTISQPISVGAAGSYTITFKAESRGGAYGPCGVIVQVDGNAVGTWDALAVSQTQWQSYQATVNLAAGSHTLTFVANNTLGGDKSTAIDDVQMVQTGVLGSLGNTAVTVASGATFGGMGAVGGAVTWQSGAKATFAVTMTFGADNSTPMAIAGGMTFEATEVHLNLPNHLPNGIYTLATSAATPVANGAFPAPVVVSGSYAAGSTGVISLDPANKKLVLTVAAGNLYQAWAGVGGPAFSALNAEGVANGLAWMLGAASPAAGNTLGLLPTAAHGTSGLTLTFKRVHDPGAAKLHLEYSTDLGTWNTPGVLVPAELEGTGTLGVDISYEVTRGIPTDDFKLTIPASHAVDGKLFGRLSASEN